MTRRWEGTISGWLRACLYACVLAACVPVAAQTTDVPQPWISYAQLVGRQFQAWLEADGDAADRLHRYLEARVLNASADAPPPAIVVRAWIGANGAVTRIEFASLGSADADATLRQLLTASPLAEAPPPDMLQPLRVRLRLTPNPEAAAGAPAPASVTHAP
ncbi:MULTISPECIES: YbaB/EbfC family DNA-binding protein [unclassified Burkholderia]|uniref:YbaB/EbfC family DNA-binding protein n=1 Tax=unclassified Burkholderia TaxID=2613784 RepID=UPI001E37EA64|nr:MULTISPECIES: YbaB/EbfC family DNA-binding protein [unclassified Burkholderia]UEP31359.1 YbaB/EbfC family DNA-binding protein [Burkholderia sp. B21-007]UEP43393.1 YbaB/EbfC family DNA-binding protein [Burkholderia sp. B21-005]